MDLQEYFSQLSGNEFDDGLRQECLELLQAGVASNAVVDYYNMALAG